MSRIFKSNYIKIGTPKAIRSNVPIDVKHELAITSEVALEINAEEQANNIIEDAKELYLKIIEEANFEAKRIIDNAQEEKEMLQATAGDNGYKDGFNTGYTEGVNQGHEIIMKAEELKQQLDDRNVSIYKEAENEIMELVIDISKKVIMQELTQNKEVMMSLIKQSINKCTFKDKLTIRVSEDDFNYVNSNKERIIMLTEGINDLEIYCDKALTKGSCIVETPSGEINAGIDVQMKEIIKAFEYLIRNE
ncbi:MAG: FliH/SctL family protein [Lutisporaceae bacterium]